MSAVNPYAAPAARVEEVDSEEERIRREHIAHEASLKAVGLLYYLGGGFFLLLGLVSMLSMRADWGGGIIVLLFLAIGGIQVATAWGVRALKPWGRVVLCIFSVLGLLGFPIGTLINGYILYLLFSKKGNMVFSPAYQDVIAATPHVKYQTPILVWIFLVLVLGFLVIGVIVAAMSGGPVR